MSTENQTKSLEQLANGIDVPQPKGKRTIYPFKAMEIGESFVVSISTDLDTDALRTKALTELQRKMSAISTMAGKRLAMKFQTRKIETGIRIWRIA